MAPSCAHSGREGFSDLRKIVHAASFAGNLRHYLANFAREFGNLATCTIIKHLVNGPITKGALAKRTKLSTDILDVELRRLESAKFIVVKEDRVDVFHHDIVVALLTLINVAKLYYTHVTHEIDADEMAEGGGISRASYSKSKGNRMSSGIESSVEGA